MTGLPRIPKDISLLSIMAIVVKGPFFIKHPQCFESVPGPEVKKEPYPKPILQEPYKLEQGFAGGGGRGKGTDHKGISLVIIPTPALPLTYKRRL